MHSVSPSRRSLVAAVLVPTVLAALTACGSGTTSAGATSPGSGTSSTTAMDHQHEVTMTDAWVKAADSGMTAAFGLLTNEDHEDVTLVKADFTGAGMVQLHETVMDGGTMRMQEKKGGFVIPAEGTFELKPGGNHIMLMDLKAPLKTGTTVELTLTFSNGSTSKVTAQVKPFTGANETYQPGSSSTTSGM